MNAKIESISLSIKSLSCDLASKSNICEATKKSLESEGTKSFRMDTQRDSIVTCQALHTEDCAVAFRLKESEILLTQSLAMLQKEAEGLSASVEENALTLIEHEKEVLQTKNNLQSTEDRLAVAKECTTLHKVRIESLTKELAQSTSKRQCTKTQLDLLDGITTGSNETNKDLSQELESIVGLRKDVQDTAERLSHHRISSREAMLEDEEKHLLNTENVRVDEEIKILKAQLREIQTGLEGRFEKYDTNRDMELNSLRNQILVKSQPPVPGTQF